MCRNTLALRSGRSGLTQSQLVIVALHFCCSWNITQNSNVARACSPTCSEVGLSASRRTTTYAALVSLLEASRVTALMACFAATKPHTNEGPTLQPGPG